MVHFNNTACLLGQPRTKLSSIRACLVAVIAMGSPAVSIAGPTILDDLKFENASKYLGIHLGTKDSGADVLSVGSDGGGAGSNNRSALGRINPTNDLPATMPGISGPAVASAAQTVPDGSDAPVSTFG